MDGCLISWVAVLKDIAFEVLCRQSEQLWMGWPAKIPRIIPCVIEILVAQDVCLFTPNKRGRQSLYQM